jgi:hypothetical protein
MLRFERMGPMDIPGEKRKQSRGPEGLKWAACLVNRVVSFGSYTGMEEE